MFYVANYYPTMMIILVDINSYMPSKSKNAMQLCRCDFIWEIITHNLLMLSWFQPYTTWKVSWCKYRYLIVPNIIMDTDIYIYIYIYIYILESIFFQDRNVNRLRLLSLFHHFHFLFHSILRISHIYFTDVYGVWNNLASYSFEMLYIKIDILSISMHIEIYVRLSALFG